MKDRDADAGELAGTAKRKRNGANDSLEDTRQGLHIPDGVVFMAADEKPGWRYVVIELVMEYKVAELKTNSTANDSACARSFATDAERKLARPRPCRPSVHVSPRVCLSLSRDLTTRTPRRRCSNTDVGKS